MAGIDDGKFELKSDRYDNSTVMIRFNALRVLLLPWILMFGASAGIAQTLTTTFQFTGSGLIGTPATATTPFQGQVFTNAAITVSAVGNTANRQSCGPQPCYYVPNDSASVSISGVGTFQFTSTVITNVVIVDPVKGVVGNTIYFAVSPTTTASASFSSPSPVATAISNSTPWNMLNSFGPFESIINLSPFQMATNGGTLQFSSQGSTGTFQATFTGTPPVPTLTRTGVLSHVVNGGMWDTKINLINTSSAPVSATVNLYGDNGTAWSLPLTITEQGTTQSTTASSANVTVNPNSTVVIATTPNPSATSVWGWADVLASGPLNGFAILRSTPTNDKPSEATVPLQTSFPSSLILPYDNTAGYVMGVALVNLATGSANINATIWDDSGNQLGVQSISVAGTGHTAFVLTDQIPVAAGKRGIIQFQNPSGGVSGLGLRFSPAGPFTDVPAIL